MNPTFCIGHTERFALVNILAIFDKMFASWGDPNQRFRYLKMCRSKNVPINEMSDPNTPDKFCEHSGNNMLQD